MNGIKEIEVANNEIAYEYINNDSYYITKSGILYSTFVKGAHGKRDITRIRRVAYGEDKDGYYRVVLSNNAKHTRIKIHQIMANQFLGGCPEGMVINHIDGNKHNNSIKNLEIITPLENTQHAWRTGLSDGSNHSMAIKVDIYDNYTGITYHFGSLAEVHENIYDISLRHIRDVMNNDVQFNRCRFVKVITGAGKTDYYIECYFNGLLLKTFNNVKEAGEAFGKPGNSISGSFHSIEAHRFNRYTITFPNVSTIENTVA